LDIARTPSAAGEVFADRRLTTIDGMVECNGILDAEADTAHDLFQADLPETPAVMCARTVQGRGDP
jgi:hypothetical protein